MQGVSFNLELGQCLDGFHGELSFYKGRVLCPRSCWPSRFTARLGFVCNPGIWIAGQGSGRRSGVWISGGSELQLRDTKEVAQGGTCLLLSSDARTKDLVIQIQVYSPCPHRSRVKSRSDGIIDYMTQRLQRTMHVGNLLSRTRRDSRESRPQTNSDRSETHWGGSVLRKTWRCSRWKTALRMRTGAAEAVKRSTRRGVCGYHNEFKCRLDQTGAKLRGI